MNNHCITLSLSDNSLVSQTALYVGPANGSFKPYKPVPAGKMVEEKEGVFRKKESPGPGSSCELWDNQARSQESMAAAAI
jgi:hypothetical protein